MAGSTVPSRLIALALAFAALIWVSPFAWLVTNSLDPASVGQLNWPSSISLSNFTDALSGKSGMQFLNSIYLAAGTATLTVAVATGAAYPLSRLKLPGQSVLLWTLVLLRLLPSTGVIVPLFFTARNLGLLNLLGVAIAMTILNLPFALLLLVTRIVMPMSRAGIAVVWFFSFTGAWNEFLLPLIFVRTDAGFPMSVGLYAAFGLNGAVKYGFLAAFSVLYAAPAIAVYFLLRRNMNTGFAGVGVKG
jgi:multiple sugar transport system permease protein